MTTKPASNFQTGVICVDFDGTLAEFVSDIESFGPVIPGCAEALAELKRHGYRIIIHTARPSRTDHLERLAQYLRDAGIPFDDINLDSTGPWQTSKPVADLYIDDRALRFEGDWRKTLARAKHLLGLNGSKPACPSSYDDLLALITSRQKEAKQFDCFLREETNWLKAPASTRFHLARTGGLLDHSVNVAATLLKLRETLATDLSEESCAVAGLYHDVGKVGMPGNPYYLPNPSDRHVRNRGIKYVVNKDLIHLDIPTRSLFLISRFLSLSEDEAQAIRYHDGQYIDENKSVAHHETKLTRLLQYADNWSGGVIEERSKLDVVDE